MDLPIIVREKTFYFKKEATLHFRLMLHRYAVGDTLNLEDRCDFIALSEENGTRLDRTAKGVQQVTIAVGPHKAKCFQLEYADGTKKIVSYLNCINGKPNARVRFTKVCRHTIQNDLRDVKQAYFDCYSTKGKVKCQETGVLCRWEELHIDHRQPNTFAMIVERFVELNSIDFTQVSYTKNENNELQFEEGALARKFREYHSEKANLRIVQKSANLGRSKYSRIQPQKKDLRVDLG